MILELTVLLPLHPHNTTSNLSLSLLYSSSVMPFSLISSFLYPHSYFSSNTYTSHWDSFKRLFKQYVCANMLVHCEFYKHTLTLACFHHHVSLYAIPLFGKYLNSLTPTYKSLTEKKQRKEEMKRRKMKEKKKTILGSDMQQSLTVPSGTPYLFCTAVSSVHILLRYKVLIAFSSPNWCSHQRAIIK